MLPKMEILNCYLYTQAPFNLGVTFSENYIGRQLGPKSPLDVVMLRKSHDTHYHPVHTTRLKNTWPRDDKFRHVTCRGSSFVCSSSSQPVIHRVLSDTA